MLGIKQNIENGKACVKLEGRLDTITAPELETALKDTFTSANELTLDFEKLEYISSAGLRALLSAHKVMARKGGLQIVGVNETIMEIFDVTGFSDILNIVK